MNSNFLETFVWLANLRSFRLTAERLNVSQPVVSSRMAALEEQLGVSLYTGSGATFQLTRAGKRILEKSEAVVLLCEEIKAIATGNDHPDKPVRIGFPELVASSWLPDLLRLVGAQMPDLRIDFHTDLARNLLDDLRNDKVDLIMSMGEAKEPGVVSTVMCSYPVHWVAGASIASPSDELGVVELAQMPIIVPSKTSYLYETMMAYFRSNNIYNLSERGRFHTFNGGYSLMGCAQLAKAGLGVTLLPLVSIEGMLQSGELKILPVSRALPSWDVFACHKISRTSPTITSIIQSASKAIQEYGARQPDGFFSAKSDHSRMQ